MASGPGIANPGSDELLLVDGVGSGYGSMQVLWDVSLRISRGEGVLLLGANGAGKTTLLKAVSGLLPLKSGSIRLDGAGIDHLRADQRVRRGAGVMTEQGVFPTLSVEDNLRLGAYTLPRAAVSMVMKDVYQLFPELFGRRRDVVGSLSGGQRKLVAVAKALMCRPQLLIMDEPSAGLSPRYVKEVVSQLMAVRQRGLSLLVAEQNVAFLELADRVYVLEGGRVRFEGTVSALEGNQAVREAFFGLGGP
ncbi:MAG: ABC transporter ATP-binding protein [Candidatus Dormibacteria bacterium]